MILFLLFALHTILDLASWILNQLKFMAGRPSSPPCWFNQGTAIFHFLDKAVIGQPPFFPAIFSSNPSPIQHCCGCPEPPINAPTLTYRAKFFCLHTQTFMQLVMSQIFWRGEIQLNSSHQWEGLNIVFYPFSRCLQFKRWFTANEFVIAISGPPKSFTSFLEGEGGKLSCGILTSLSCLPR